MAPADRLAQSALIDQLIEAAMAALHHDANKVDTPVDWERALLRRKFTAVLTRHWRKVEVGQKRIRTH